MKSMRFIRGFAFCLGIGLLASQNYLAATHDLDSGGSSFAIRTAGNYEVSHGTAGFLLEPYHRPLAFRVGSTGGEQSFYQMETASAQGPRINVLIVDVDLRGLDAGDAVIPGQSTFGPLDFLYQAKSSSVFWDEIVGDEVRQAQSGPYPAIYNSLRDNTASALNNHPGPVTGDVTWAFQWDAAVTNGALFNVELNKSEFNVIPVPEPSTLVLIPIALALLGAARRRTKSRCRWSFRNSL